MHELSIALGIVDVVAEEAALRERRIVAVYLKLGALTGVVPDALRSAFALAREQEPDLTTAELVIEEVPVATFCPTCSVEREVIFPELICPTCGTPTPDVLRGRELEVVAVEIET